MKVGRQAGKLAREHVAKKLMRPNILFLDGCPCTVSGLLSGGRRTVEALGVVNPRGTTAALMVG